MSELSTKQKLTNYCYFVIFNSILACVIGVGYFYSDFRNPIHLFSTPTDIVSLLSLVLSHFSSIIFLVLLVSLVVAPCIWLKNKADKYCIALITTLCLFYLFLDIISHYYFAFSLYDLLSVLKIIHLPIELNTNFKIALFGLIIILYVIEYIFILKLESYSIKPKFIYSFMMLFVIISIGAYGIFYKVLPKNKQNLIASSQVIPWFYPSTQFMNKISKPQAQGLFTNIKNLLFAKPNNINYPLKPLKTSLTTKPPNIIIIGIDCWRADYFNAVDTPNLWQFAKTGKIFNNHLSAGNCTRLGLFGLFYGIPATYWRNFLNTKKSSVFIDRLLNLHYQFNSFTWANKKEHPLVYFFLDSIHKRYEPKGNTPAEIDNNITEDWLAWHQQLNKSKPYFSFVWYGSVYGNDFPEGYTQKYFPTAGSYRYHDLVKQYGKDAFIGTYKTAVNYIDDLASEIIEQLQKTDDLVNTIVVITSDHGQDFAENRQNFWGHGTNFTDGQIRVPFAIIGPKFANTELACNNKLTTHYDFVPTIMQNFLGVTNDISDYSVGIDLLDKNSKNSCNFVTGNLKWCGIASSDYIINFHPSCNYYITDKQNQPVFKAIVDHSYLIETLKIIYKFLD